MLKLFNHWSVFSKWPSGVLAQMILLKRNYIREFCIYCERTLKFSRSSRSGDSGGICAPCLLRECPEAYYSMKEEGKLTPLEIEEAEGSAP
ncbi:MAG: hypothetical protein A2Y67_03735 [Candidatus Buchananbacteria bacterium RBG_13_39_9]|uniref:Uncharacterized protein n=1 Tax=Candidatus Buchananbacteria bacterium RBG_13_39_9 TaxID=1797531 RepID=A0A1G1XS05_9BACT|nr:MAG: hypothetical protein A2Y67_03735 [Candidatus Buchananbacteria bacterium RBG_13_39_9]